MKKTNFTLVSKAFKMFAVLLAFGFYSISSSAQCPDFNPDVNLMIAAPGIVCGDLGPNLLANPSFEDPVIPFNTEFFTGGVFPALSGWTQFGINDFGGGFTNQIVANNFGAPPARTGDNNLKVFGNFFAPFTTNGFFQDFPAVPGETYSGSMYAQLWEGDLLGPDNFSELHLEYLDANGCLLAGEGFSSSQQITLAAAPLNEYVKYTTVSTAPAGAVTVRFVQLFFNVNFNGGAIFFDDASLQLVSAADPIVIDGGVADDQCLSSVVVPPLGDLFTAGDFTAVTFSNDFNGGMDASGDYPFGTTVVNVVAVDADGNESSACPLVVEVIGGGSENGVMACNDLVNISITDSDDGCSLVSVDAILEGDGYGCFDQYEVVRVHDLLGSCTPDPAPSGHFWVNCGDVGTTITLKVIDPVTGNSCWGDAHIEDKEQPTLECDVTFTDINGDDQTGIEFNLTCSEDPDDVGLPTPVDNCDNPNTMNVNLISETTTGDLCDVLTIVRVYQTSDSNGNLSNTCTHTINIVQPEVIFPEDETFSCEQFASNNNIITASSSGAGEPNVVGTNCRFGVVYDDQILEACDGVDIAVTFKILRTWTVLNWCDGTTETAVQIIKVVDEDAPEISASSITLLTNQSSGSGNHTECFSSGLIPAPSVTDNCSGVAEVRVFTPVGEGVAVTNGSGDVIGYSIPSPFLAEGEHEITIQATDACGNIATETVEVEVVDETPPIPICREVTQIAVSSEPDGIAEVSAIDFDEGSYDECGPVYFKVRRMDDNCPGFTTDRSRFNDEIRFCCDDIGETVLVVLRVYDVNPGVGSVTISASQDRANECMIEVLVEDKIRPECFAPANVVTTCSALPDNFDFDDDAALDALFGTATVLDNCSADLQVISTNANLDLCGVGSITRTWRAEDPFGNRSIGSCRQIITVQPITDYCITFPEDYIGECDNTNAPADLTFVENGCDLIAVSSEEEPFNAGGPAGDECRKVIRTWKVINWCEYDGVSSATVVLRDGNGDGNVDDGEYCSTGGALVFQPNNMIAYPSTGFYQYGQLVTVFDNTAPDISYDGAVKFCGGDMDEDPCTGQVDIELDITELCTDNLTTTWAISAFSSSFSSTDINGSGAISTRLPLGTHTARFQVTDDCGNTSQLDITFSIVDCKAPTPVCHNGLSIDVMPLSGMVELWAVDFDASSFDYCSDFIFRANVINDTNGDGVITNDDYATTLPADDFIILDCDDVSNGITMVQIWVAEQDGTADDGCADNQDNDFCVTFVEVQDNNGVCSSSRVAVGGKITNEVNESVENVTIEVNSGASMLNSVVTDATGNYNFSLPLGGDYSITPMRNDDAANGVSTFDLVLVSKHILNVSLLNSPYKVLAADANNSGSISTLDLVAIRKVVLRLTNEFPNNTSWRFVEKSHIFNNSNNPWSSNIPELYNVNNLTVDQLNANFTAIKVGDVNGDSRANGILGIDDRSFNGNFEFNVEEQNFKAGEEVAVTFTSEDLTSVDGYQFTLKFNEKVLELVSIQNGVATAENFGTTMAKDGYITTSWNGTATDSEAFTAIFNAKAAGTLSNEIAISSELTNAEAYEGVDYKNVSINFGSDVASNEFTLYQNTPNPFKGETVIGFDLPTASTATLTVSDVSGKILKVVNGDFAKGYNTVTLGSDELSTGVLYYQLDTEGFTKTMKMVVIK